MGKSKCGGNNMTIFYHGGASRPVLENIREACPSLTHGNGFTPSYYYDREHPYFLDNGAFTSDFNPEKWKEMLDEVLKFDSNPDFVVLPDVFDNPQKTFDRARKYVIEVQKRDMPYYYVAQKPESAFQAIHKAIELGADGVFIGGSWDWKQREAPKIINLAHENGLKAHIGMPNDYYWAYTTGADSMDSVTIGRNEDYNRARNLENKINSQKSLNQVIEK